MSGGASGPVFNRRVAPYAAGMSIVTETVLFVFGLAGLGYVAAATGYLKPGTGEALAEFAVGVSMPLLLFSTMAGADFHGAVPWKIWTAYFAAVIVVWTAGHLAATRLFRADAQTGVVAGVSSAFSNLVLLGVPFMGGVFGREGVETTSLVIAVHLPSMLMASIVLFQLFGRRGELHPLAAVGLFTRRFATNPLILGVLAGLAWRFGGLEMPGIAARLVAALAGVASPLALFAMGAGLWRYGVSGTVLPALVLSALKIVAMPALTLFACLLLALPPETTRVLVCAAGLPAGVNSYLIATQFGTGQALASNVMTLATAGAVVTIPAWLAVLDRILG
jgi:malonate transporter and related proteins